MDMVYGIQEEGETADMVYGNTDEMGTADMVYGNTDEVGTADMVYGNTDEIRTADMVYTDQVGTAEMMYGNHEVETSFLGFDSPAYVACRLQYDITSWSASLLSAPTHAPHWPQPLPVAGKSAALCAHYLPSFSLVQLPYPLPSSLFCICFRAVFVLILRYVCSPRIPGSVTPSQKVQIASPRCSQMGLWKTKTRATYRRSTHQTQCGPEQ